MSNSFSTPPDSGPMSAPSALRQRLAKREDSEHEQALLRIVIVGLVLAYMAGFHGWPSTWSAINREIVVVLTGFFSVAVAIFVSICLYPRKNVVRRLVGMVADTGGCTWYMWVAGDYGFFVIGIYLFVTFGNGFRYGRRYLFGCQALSIMGLLSVLLYVPYWQERTTAGIGLLLALIVLPLYVSTLLKRIQEAPRARRGSQHGEDHVPREHEPRDAHAAERHRRRRRPVPHDRALRAAGGARAAAAAFRHRAALARRRRARHQQDRGGPAGRGRRQLRPATRRSTASSSCCGRMRSRRG